MMYMHVQLRRWFMTIPLSLLWATLCFASAGLPVQAVVAPAGVEAPGSGQTTPSSASAKGNSVSSYSLPAGQMRRAEALYRTRTALYVAGTGYGIAIMAVLLAVRIAPLYRDLAGRLARGRLLQALIFVPLLLLTCDLLSLPIGLYGHHLQLSYGLSVQNWGSWFWDRAKMELVTLLLLVPLLWGFYALIGRSPARWWIYAWLSALPVLVFVVFVAPVVLDPLFSHFEPLENTRPDLVSAIEQVAQRGGLQIPRSRIFTMNASEKFTTYNAYVTGIAATKRIVVWDTTARDLTVPQVLFIFGHEMGHYVLDHVYKGMAWAAALMLAALGLGKVIADRVLARWGQRWGIRGLSDWASLPLLMLIFSVLSFLGEPIANGFSRHLEHQADIYGLEVTHGIVLNQPETAARDFQLLGEKSLSYPYPNPLLVFWAYDHPPIAERLRFALHYDPWGKGQPTKYVH
ncbi:MAG: M48 family metalloprotease [Candidatus Korobacteraceae bacterium]